MSDASNMLWAVPLQHLLQEVADKHPEEFRAVQAGDRSTVGKLSGWILSSLHKKDPTVDCGGGWRGEFISLHPAPHRGRVLAMIQEGARGCAVDITGMFLATRV